MDIDKEIAQMNIKISTLVSGVTLIYIENVEDDTTYWYHACTIDVVSGRLASYLLFCNSVRMVMPISEHIITTNAAHPLIIQQYIDYVSNNILPTRREMEHEFIKHMLGREEKTPEYSILCHDDDDDKTKQ